MQKSKKTKANFLLNRDTVDTLKHICEKYGFSRDCVIKNGTVLFMEKMKNLVEDVTANKEKQ